MADDKKKIKKADFGLVRGGDNDALLYSCEAAAVRAVSSRRRWLVGRCWDTTWYVNPPDATDSM